MKIFFKKILTILKTIIQIPLNIILGLLYFILILPFSFIYKNSFDPRTNKAKNAIQTSFWIDPEPKNPSLENLRRQF